MTSFEIGILSFIAFVCTFAIIDRICKCVEHCATARSYSECAAIEASKETSVDKAIGFKR